MFKIVVLSVFLASAIAVPQKIPGKITGGEPVVIKSSPYVLSLIYQGSHICGASLISFKYAVTAAHCTSGASPSQLKVRVGSSFRNSGGKVVDVKTIHQNPSFSPVTYDYDISVLELEALELDDSVDVISLPTQNQAIAVNAAGKVYGWGKLSEGGPYPFHLHAVKVSVLRNDDCSATNGGSSLTVRMMCAGVSKSATDGKGVCQGDDGGPLVIGGELIGIVSRIDECTTASRPGIYSSVPALRNYISTVSGV